MDEFSKLDNFLTQLGTTAAKPATADQICILFAAVMLVFVFFIHTVPDMEAESDFFEGYIVEAKAFLDGSIAIDDYRGPLYPIVLALTHTVLSRLGADFFGTGKLLSLICAVWMLFLTNRYIRRIVDVRVATVVVLLMVVNPTFLRYSYTASTDVPCSLLMTLALYRWLSSGGRTVPLIVAGAVTALAYLMRYNSAALLAGFVLAMLMVNPWRQSWWRRGAATATVVMSFAVVILPWCLHLNAEKGHPFYSKNYLNVAYTYYAPPDGAEQFVQTYGNQLNGYWDVLTFDIGRLVGAIPESVDLRFMQFVIQVLLWPTGLLAALGLVLVFARPPDRLVVASYVVGGVVLASVMLIFFSTRLYLFVLPFVLLLATQGAVFVGRGLAGGGGASARRTRAVLVGGAVFVLAFSAVSSAAYMRKHLTQGMPEARTFAERFIEITPESQRAGQRVAARKPYFAYYADLEFVRIPVGLDYDAFLKYLHARDVRYVYFSYIAARTRPELKTLMDERFAHRGLRALATSQVAVLYEVIGAGEQSRQP